MKIKKFKVVIELSIDDDSIDMETVDYIQQEIGWASPSFSDFKIVSTKEIK